MSRSTWGSAFSWIMSDAEVWVTWIVSKPSLTVLSRTNPHT